MSFKIVAVFCVQAFLAQIAFSHCICPGVEYIQPPAPSCGGLGGIGYGAGHSHSCGGNIEIGGNSGYSIGSRLPYIDVQPTHGGSLITYCASPIAPSGLSLISESILEGEVYVVGELPFLSAVSVNAAFPSSGSGIVNHIGGTGNTGIISESSGAGYAGLGLGSAGIGLGSAGIGLGSAGIGLGSAGIGLGSAGIGLGSAGIGLGSAGIGLGSVGSCHGSGSSGISIGGCGGYGLGHGSISGCGCGSYY